MQPSAAWGAPAPVLTQAVVHTILVGVVRLALARVLQRIARL
jgi:hypothetical protein